MTNGNWRSSTVYNLGDEYNNKVCGTAHFYFVIDDDGVVTVTKTSSTKESLFFTRISEKEFKELKAKKLEEEKRYKIIDERNNKIWHRIDQIHAMIDNVNEDMLRKIMNTSIQLDLKTIERKDCFVKRCRYHIDKLQKRIKFEG